MSQVNKYANKAGYTADKNRKDTQSAVSYIEDDGAGGGGMVAAVVGRGLPADARQGVFRR